MVEHPGAGVPAPGGLLVRLPLGDGLDLDRLPAVPAPRTCTVTVNLTDADALPVADLADRGYAVGSFANVRADAAPCADVLVPAPLATNDAWLAPLVAAADRVYALDLGPVRRVFADELAAHRVLAGR